MLDRLVLVVLLILLAWGGVVLWRRYQRWHLDALNRLPGPDCLADLSLRPVPAILYFTTATCSQCRLRQTPILRQLEAEWGDAVHICTVDAVAYEALARHFGILTVPSTVVLDARRRVVAINHGLAEASRLRQQIGSTGRWTIDDGRWRTRTVTSNQ
ncbi:MAG: thioredoxin family protein [Anaerolineae bacterium]|nr:thioredoxin family protein [Caldilineales bacterium]MCX7852161.1 thioredoxin family protein [Caldilineales bacterium]MDW8269608.1 thioredoxin family protein [Anaerolineae bacterium]